MATIDADAPVSVLLTVADVLAQASDFPAERIRLYPVPGTATEGDLVRTNERKEHGLCELVDGILVEKPMGDYESCLGAELVRLLGNYCAATRRGMVLGEAGTARMQGGNVRVPDVSYISHERLKHLDNPRKPIWGIAPELAVEVLSKRNTKAEMARKRREYFSTGVRLVWELDPETRVMRVYTAAEEFREIDEQGMLDGGDVLPGFSVRVGELFAQFPRQST